MLSPRASNVKHPHDRLFPRSGVGSAECITGQVWPAIICICITLIIFFFILILLILLILVILIPIVIVIVINHRSGQLVWLFKAIDNQERHTFCQVRSYW